MGSVMTARPAWPLQTHLVLGAQPTVPGVARGHVRAVACEWGLAELADTAALLVSELTTNAVQASERFKRRTDQSIVPVVKLWVTSDQIAMIVHVWDASPEKPTVKDIAIDDEGGRGLLLVTTLCKEWGVYLKDGGKVVWAMITGDP
jgi:anti-sigma regulatory factor (Ser/Thr protein kinase)